MHTSYVNELKNKPQTEMIFTKVQMDLGWKGLLGIEWSNNNKVGSINQQQQDK